MAELHFFSFGGGVQSTAIALMLIYQPHRFAKLPDYIVFADPGAESPQTYRHIKKIFKMLRGAGFNCYIIRPKQAIQHSDRGLQTVPWFTRSVSGSTGMLRRQCTKEYKIEPINRFIRRELGYEKGQRVKANDRAVVWLGISTDEIKRVAENPRKWITNFYPLIEMGIDRNECQLLNYHYLDYLVPKSSCYFCPFTKRSEWERRKREDPKAFDRAVKLDESIRALPKVGKAPIEDPCFVSGTGYPLKDATSDQLVLDLGFEKECSGNCGV
jgi:hypothetical protein